jgi:phosphatidylglycerophosphate synthase
MKARAGDEAGQVLVVMGDGGSEVEPSDRLGGMPIAERLLRAAARAGYDRVLVWAPREHAVWTACGRRLARPADVTAIGSAEAWQTHVASLDPRMPVTLVAPAIVASPSLLAAAADLIPTHEDPLIEQPVGAICPRSGVFRTLPEYLAAPEAIATQVRRSDPPGAAGAGIANTPGVYSLSLRSRSDLAAAERRLRQSIIKTTDGYLARLNRRMSIPISVALIRSMRLSAHAMSLFLLVLGVYSGWLFSRGTYVTGVLGAVVAWIASVLDGCDGELARLQFTESPLGCWLDTLGDYSFYIAMFIGLTTGAVRQSGWPGFWWIGGILLAGTLLTMGLLMLLRGRITSGAPERLRAIAQTHFKRAGKAQARLAWLSTCATRATMPYGVIAFALLGQLPAVLVLAMVGAQMYWIGLAAELRNLVDGARRGVGAAEPVL